MYHWILPVLLLLGTIALFWTFRVEWDSSDTHESIYNGLSSARVRREVAQMAEVDNIRCPISTTLWTQAAEEMSSPPTVKRLSLLYKMADTAVYTFQEDPKKVIIYRQRCGPLHDETLVDFWFLSYLRETRAVPVVFGVSKPLDGQVILTEYGMHPQAKLHIRQCREGGYARVRYMIMERVMGQPVDAIIGSHRDRLIPISRAAQICINVLKALREIHAQHVVHGDIHEGNLLVDGFGSVKIIDFEYATIFDSEEIAKTSYKLPCNMPIIELRGPLAINSQNSPWESQGCTSSFRDDVYRVLIVLGTMIHGFGYTDLFGALSERREGDPYREGSLRAWVQLRTDSRRFFDIDTTANQQIPKPCRVKFLLSTPVRPLSHSVVYMFERLANLVMFLKIDQRPSYDAMISVLGQIVRATEES